MTAPIIHVIPQLFTVAFRRSCYICNGPANIALQVFIGPINKKPVQALVDKNFHPLDPKKGSGFYSVAACSNHLDVLYVWKNLLCARDYLVAVSPKTTR